LIETGYQDTNAEAVSTTVQYPQAFVRIGTVVPALEVDLGLPMYQRLHAAGAISSGTTDAGAGLKYVFGYTPRFNYGASVFFTTPTGTNGFSAGRGEDTIRNFKHAKGDGLDRVHGSRAAGTDQTEHRRRFPVVGIVRQTDGSQVLARVLGDCPPSVGSAV